VQSAVQWTFAASRAFIWYGFLFALIAAELYAGRVLRRLVRDSLAHPSLGELEQMLREPLGDSSLRLGFWRSSTRDWAAPDGTPLEPPGAGQALTEVERDGHPAAAIVHDEQLAEDPELLQAAGAVALLALENAELDLAWKESLRELADSRARITKASDRERRNLERDLRDGAQQRLLGVLLRLSAANELTAANPDLQRQIARAERELEDALRELRELAHGIYPAVLADHGLAGALRAITRRFPGRVSVTETTEGRFSPEIEAAFYYCCLEAIQNAIKHAGPDAHIRIRLHADTHELHLEVSDNGLGFDHASAPDGMGLQNMRDRLSAVHGHIEIFSSPGRGTLVKAGAPSTPSPVEHEDQPDASYPKTDYAPRPSRSELAGTERQ
jgi:signal transduction histidine kinase